MPKKYQSFIFDVDSTLCTIEGIDELAMMRGVGGEIKPLTQQAMDGELTLDEVFAKRLELIQPQQKDIELLGRLYCQNVSPHVRGVISQLSDLKKDLYIVSGGYKEALCPLAHLLSIPKEHIFANSLIFSEKGEYKGFDRSIPLWREDGKKEVIQSLRLKGKSMLVGDGISDAVAKDAVDCFVGYGGNKDREKVRSVADYFITDMQELMPINGVI